MSCGGLLSSAGGGSFWDSLSILTGSCNGKEPTLALVGDTFIDIIVRLEDERLPVWGEDLLSKCPFTIAAGGSALNTAVHAAEIGTMHCCQVQLHSPVGSDSLAMTAKSRLKDAGVELHSPAALQDESSGSCLVLAGPEDRAFVTYRGKVALLRTEDLAIGPLRDADHVHVAGFYNCPLLGAGLPGLLESLREQGVGVSLCPQFDASQTWEGLDLIYPHLDYLIVNAVEAVSLATKRTATEEEAKEVGDMESGAAARISRKVLEKGVKCVVITAGSKGALAAYEAKTAATGETEAGTNDSTRDESRPAPLVMIFQRTHELNVVDATGAGDAFAAGFLQEILHVSGDLDDEPQHKYRAALRRGCSFGSAAVEVVGASTPLDAGRIRKIVEDMPEAETFIL